MKLGILTYHRAINMGSIVQAYCLQKKLKAEYPDAAVEVIDYRPGIWDYRESAKHLSKRWPFFNRRRHAEIRAIRGFARRVLTLSNGHITTRDLERAGRWLEEQGYDGIFVGSDTVWEYRTRSYSPPELNVFHLPWTLQARKFSFAASADPVPPNGVQNPAHREVIVKAISDFDVLGIRDDATFGMLRDIGVDTKEAHKVLDPTLHVDFLELAEPFRIENPGGKPLAGVAAAHSVAPKIAAILRARGFAVWNWGTSPRDWADGHLPTDLTAEQVLGAYRNLTTFVTDRFHGSIFTMKIGSVAPVFIETQEKWPIANSKGRDLYGELGLSDRVLRDDEADWIERLGALAENSKAAPASTTACADRYFASVSKVLRQ